MTLAAGSRMEALVSTKKDAAEDNALGTAGYFIGDFIRSNPAFVASAVPIVFLSTMSWFGAAWFSWYLLWDIAAAAWLFIGLPAVFGFAIMRKREIARGLFEGLTAGLVALTLTYFTEFIDLMNFLAEFG